jgi:hypothetical protein
MARSRTTDRLIPLSEAAWYFAPRKLKVELDRVRSLPAGPIPPLNAENAAEATKALFETLGAVNNRLTIINEPVWAMQKHLLQQLSAGKLEAFGIMIKPEIGRELQRIPAFIFENSPKVKWGNNAIENVGHRFEAIKVRRAGSVRVEMPSPVRDSLKEKGRPSKADEINRAIDELLAQGVDLGNMERPRAEDKIKKYARDVLKANIKIGYSKPVIQRAFFHRFGKRR